MTGKRSATARGRLQARLLLGALLLAIAAAVRADRGARLAAPLRANEPLAVWVSARFAGQGRVVPPALYLAVYGPAARTLDLVGVPPETGAGAQGRTLADVYGEAYVPGGDVKGAAAAMAAAARALVEGDASWHAADYAPLLHLKLPAGSRPAFPREMKSHLGAVMRRPGFWLKPRPVPVDIAAYDAWLLARELRRLDADNVFLSVLPEPGLRGVFLRRLFGRAAGAPAPKTTVEVLNASSAPGVALKAAKVLRLRGFDVIHFGNAPANEEAVRVLDRAGAPEAARRVLGTLGCPDTEVVTEMQADPEASVTVVLGGEHRRCRRLR